ncbi:ShlB/FhaC/HecB family hemolysin secretion/activation protein [Alcaligenaceae bacterium]|nr:ShlB/FhaC/HecB family hemolysin secretion/activation protein [Alcaligenaceae bacterium]
MHCLGLALAGFAFVALPRTAFAQVYPGSGAILQQVEPSVPEPSPGARPDLSIEPQAAPATSDSTPIRINQITLSGNTSFDTPTLHALVAQGEGRNQTIGQLNALAQIITDYYHAHGHPLARAYLPPQTLENATVEIAVLEARYGKVDVINNSLVSDGPIAAVLAPLRPGDVITQEQLDSRLLLLGDLPGIKPHATLSPGAAVGTADLAVRAEAGPLVTGSATADGLGNRYTGRARLGANLDIHSPLKRGDLLSANVLSSGKGLTYGRLAYQLAVGGSGTRLGAAYSALTYRLAGGLGALEAHGTASVASAWLSQPFIRSPNVNVTGRVQFNRKTLDDRIDVAALVSQRHSDSATFGLDATRRDGLGGGGITLASASFTPGRLRFDNLQAQTADANSVKTAGSYTRWNATLARLQTLTRTTRLYASLSGQYSPDNLDPSEQFLLGGAYSVRGYETGTLGGSSGYLATVELRQDLPIPLPGQWQGTLFSDTGAVRRNAHPIGADANVAHISDAGLALDWTGPHQWAARVQVAIPVGATPTIAGERPSARVWVQLTKGF